MVTLCWAAKGGSGTTVVTSALALASTRPALLVDLAGDVPALFGIAEPSRPGVLDWLRSDGPPAQLVDLVVDIDDSTALLPSGTRDRRVGLDDTEPVRWHALIGWLHDWEQRHEGGVWIDAGTGDLPAVFADLDTHRWLVTRACYLALRRAARAPVAPTGVVLVAEPGRQLRSRDIEQSAGAPIVATIDVDPKVARCVDSGFLTNRPPRLMRRDLRRATA